MERKHSTIDLGGINRHVLIVKLQQVPVHAAVVIIETSIEKRLSLTFFYSLGRESKLFLA